MTDTWFEIEAIPEATLQQFAERHSLKMVVKERPNSLNNHSTERNNHANNRSK